MSIAIEYDVIKKRLNHERARKPRNRYCNDDLQMTDPQALTILILIAEEYEDERLWQDAGIDELDKKAWSVQVRNAIIQVKRIRKAIHKS